jgi:hypothetical protein
MVIFFFFVTSTLGLAVAFALLAHAAGVLG